MLPPVITMTGGGARRVRRQDRRPGAGAADIDGSCPMSDERLGERPGARLDGCRLAGAAAMAAASGGIRAARRAGGQLVDQPVAIIVDTVRDFSARRLRTPGRPSRARARRPSASRPGEVVAAPDWPGLAGTATCWSRPRLPRKALPPPPGAPAVARQDAPAPPASRCAGGSGPGARPSHRRRPARHRRPCPRPPLRLRPRCPRPIAHPSARAGPARRSSPLPPPRPERPAPPPCPASRRPASGAAPTRQDLMRRPSPGALPRPPPPRARPGSRRRCPLGARSCHTLATSRNPAPATNDRRSNYGFEALAPR